MKRRGLWLTLVTLTGCGNGEMAWIDWGEGGSLVVPVPIPASHLAASDASPHNPEQCESEAPGHARLRSIVALHNQGVPAPLDGWMGGGTMGFGDVDIFDKGDEPGGSFGLGAVPGASTEQSVVVYTAAVGDYQNDSFYMSYSDYLVPANAVWENRGTLHDPQLEVQASGKVTRVSPTTALYRVMTARLTPGKTTSTFTIHAADGTKLAQSITTRVDDSSTTVVRQRLDAELRATTAVTAEHIELVLEGGGQDAKARWRRLQGDGQADVDGSIEVDGQRQCWRNIGAMPCAVPCP